MTPTQTTLQARIVGALACQENSYLQSLETEVISCTKQTPAKTSKNVKGGASKLSGDESSTPWLIEFADSVLFPEGGGQPTDHGNLVPLTNNSTKTVPITNVQRHGLQCIIHSPEPLDPGTRVRQEVDFGRRWDHMQQHTGQHLLSAVMDTYDNLKTLSWGMGAADEMNYIELPRKPSPAEIAEIQQRCNQVIRDNLPITVCHPEDAKTDKMPDDYDQAKGVIRVISIGDIDSNTCCGTHLSQTSHIALILLHHTTPIRSTNVRLYFSAGDRAIRLATASIDAIRSIAVNLSTTSIPTEVVAQVSSMTETVADLKKKEKKLLMEIGKSEADRVKSEWKSGKKNVWVYRPSDNPDFVSSLLFEIRDAVKEASGLVVLASGEERKKGQVIITGDGNLVEAMVSKAKEAVSALKGGGKGEKWQGKVVEWKKGEVESLQSLVADLEI